MDNSAAPNWLERSDGLKLAVRHRPGDATKPTLVFLPGYASDMQGGKAVALDGWAAASGLAMLRLDYAGCGESEGDFADGTLAMWRDDALLAIKSLVGGPVLLIGSSMGGWLALLIAQALGAQVAGLVGIAAAPDFTRWGFDEADKQILMAEGRLLRPSDYGPEPMLTTLGFWQSGEILCLLDGEIGVDCPVRLLQGQCDTAVPWEVALDIAQRLRSADVQVTLLKDGDHRLSREADIALLISTVARLMETL
jgi:pimeloyl-ACP methyl ester carboxylesterase